MSKQEHIVLLFFFIGISTFLSAQEKELVVSYQFDRVELKYKDLESSEIERHNIPTYSLKVFTYGNFCLRQTMALVFGKINKKTGVMVKDTTYFHALVDYTKGKMWSATPYQIFGYTTYLQEPINLFKWKFAQETKSILGYKCTKATCNFRGRDYVAYFTREFPFKAAPWKFHGLPGVILEVYSTDDIVKWKAQALKVRPRQPHPEIPTAVDEVLSLEQYIKVLIKTQRNRDERLEPEILRFPDFEYDTKLTYRNSTLPNSIEIFDLE